LFFAAFDGIGQFVGVELCINTLNPTSAIFKTRIHDLTLKPPDAEGHVR